MLSYIQAIILGGLQGATELFPVSSLGHSVVLPSLLGWNIDQGTENFLAFLIATHLATALVLLFFFLSDWIKIIKGVLISIYRRNINPEDVYTKLGWLIVIGTIPVGILGLLFEKSITHLFASPHVIAVFLILNGIMLYGIEIYKRVKRINVEKNLEHNESSIDIDKNITKLTWVQVLKIGGAECLALIPGFSRTGATLGGGLLTGLDHMSAARFSFLLATPVIFAASVLKLPKIVLAGQITIIGPIIAGSLVSALFAYLSVRFLTKYFKKNTLIPFGVYCIIFGIIALIWA